MKAGLRNRRVEIQQRVETQDPTYGTISVTWETLATVRAEIQDMIPSRGERIAEGVSIARRPCRVRMLYRGDLDSTMRLKHGDRVLKIVNQPAELGFREGVEIVAEEVTTEGQEP